MVGLWLYLGMLFWVKEYFDVLLFLENEEEDEGFFFVEEVIDEEEVCCEVCRVRCWLRYVEVVVVENGGMIVEDFDEER